MVPDKLHLLQRKAIPPAPKERAWTAALPDGPGDDPDGVRIWRTGKIDAPRSGHGRARRVRVRDKLGGKGVAKVGGRDQETSGSREWAS